MAKNNQNISAARAMFGMNKDSSKQMINDGEYIHARNAFINNQAGDVPLIQNAPSTFECLNLNNKQIIGSIYIKEKQQHILFLFDNNNNHEIGIFNDCLYNSTIIQECLNFNINYPIKGVYRYDLNNDLIVYFQDGLNPDRRINLTNPPFIKEGPCADPSDQFDCNAINILNDFTIPIVRPIDISDGGRLKSGTIQAKIAYSDASGNEITPYYSLTNVIPIYQDPIQGYDQTEGSPADTPTNKSVTFAFSNIDPKFSFISVAFISTVANGPLYHKVILPAGQSTYTLTRLEGLLTTSLSILNNSKPGYLVSKTMTSANNYLIRANLEDLSEVNFQYLANRIELNWCITKRFAENTASTPKSPLEHEETTGYMRGEVYGFAIKFLLENGLKSRAFHIPGRKIMEGEDDMIDDACVVFNPDICSDEDVTQIERWKVEDTSTIENVNFDAGFCDGEIVASGKFAYWESTDFYPCLEFYEENKEQPIRHHKFPSNETVHIFDLDENSATSSSLTLNKTTASISSAQILYSKRNFIYPIGVMLKDKVKNYILALEAELITFLNGIPGTIDNYINEQEAKKLLKDLKRIKGYEIVRTSRDNNKSIVAKGLLYNMREYEDSFGDDTYKVLYPNYPYNPEGPDYYHKLKNVSTQETSIILAPTSPPAQPTVGTYTVGTPGVFGDLFTVFNDLVITVPTFPSGYDWSKSVKVVATKTTSCDDENKYRYEVCFYFYVDEDSLDDFEEVFDEYCLALQYVGGATSSDFDDCEEEVTENISLDKFTFHSPDTHFNKPFLPTELRTHTVDYGSSEGWFDTVDNHPFLKVARAKADFMNHGAQHKSIGNYSASYTNLDMTSADSTINRRQLSDRFYLPGNSVNRSNVDNDEFTINNKFRESSVFLRLVDGCDIKKISEIDALLTDLSLYTINFSTGGPGSAAITRLSGRNDNNVGLGLNTSVKTYKKISSYYSSLVNYISNQYGQLETVNYVNTGKTYLIGVDQTNPFAEPDNPYFFGGDTFITKFSLKRKHAFFTIDYIDQEPAGINYKENPNVVRPRYYLINEKIGGAKELIVDKSSKLDMALQNNGRNGFVYLYNYGIPYFFVESSINTELRYSGNNEFETYYPVLNNTTLERFMEHKWYPITLDNFYLYDRTYSKQNTEEINLPISIGTFEGNNRYPRRIVYSIPTDSQSISDGWIIYQENNKYDSDDRLGDIVDVHAIDNFRVLVRYQNGLQLFNAYDTLQLDQTTITVGTGGMFAQRPKTFAETDIGYGGTRSKFVVDVTEFGTFMVDNENKKVFQYTGTLNEISRSKMSSWFNENMDLKFMQFFNLVKDKPNADKFNFDNPYNFIGFTSVYDSKYNLWFLTKKDYIPPIDDIEIGLISFTPEGVMLYDQEPVQFKGEDKSWTIAYSPLTQHWISFYDFKPTFYLEGKQMFYSGIASINKHWNEFEYQTFYDEYFPFEITLITKEPVVNTLHSIEYELRTLEYINSETYKQVQSNFTHLYVNTDHQTTGLLELQLQNKTDLRTLVNNISTTPTEATIQYSKLEGNKFRVNTFRDITSNRSLPILREEGDSRTPVNFNTNRINNLVLGNQKLRNEWFEVTFIKNDVTNKKHKLMLNLILNKINRSIR